MKRFVFGLWLSLLGFLGTMTCLVCAVEHSCNYNGLSGMWGGFMETRLTIPIFVSLLILVRGLFLAARESRRDGKGRE
ncbi:MAG: hypothetical protein HFG05_07745 [Oscillibacter sp.]|nr:hypothetical protein [Oscillibacter sp.]